MDGNSLKKSIYFLAFKGNLTKQLDSDENINIFISKLNNEKIRLCKEKRIKKSNPIKPMALDNPPFEIPKTWTWFYIEDVTYPVGNKNNQIQSKDVKEEGTIPIVSQSFKLIDGYTEESEKKIDDLPVILFGDHTKNVKFIDFEFVIGADGTKLLKPILIDPKYLYYLLSFEASLLQDRGYARHYSLLKETPMPLAPYGEQLRIVQKLDSLSSLVEMYSKYKAILSKLEDDFRKNIKTSIIMDAIKGNLTKKYPVTETGIDLLKKITKNKEEKFKKGIFKNDKKKIPNDIIDDEILFDIPNHWSWIKLGNLAYFQAGKTPERNNPNLWGKEIPWISISDMIPNGITTSTEEFITEEALNFCFDNKLVPQNTLLMSFKLTIGKVTITSIDCQHNEAIVAIYPYLDGEDGETIKKYLFKILPVISQYGNFNNAVKGKTLNATSISNLMIPLPPINEQKEIIKKVDELIELVSEIGYEKD